MYTEDKDAYWMPFTANRQFKKNPRMLAKAEGMYYWTPEGRQVLDGCAGLWCVNAGHNRPHIVKAIQEQAAKMDYAPSFQMGHPLAFELSERLAALAPEGLGHVFYGNSGSEADDTALKIALAYQKVRGQGSRTRLIGREKGYHGVNFGGLSVGGIGANRAMFGPLLPGVDHLPHTLDIARNAFSRGLPEYGDEKADVLEDLVKLHDPSTIAAVIVEPMSGSAGVILPSKGYLKRLREICTKYGILLIFDEVITGYGRVGAPFASQAFGVTPDIMSTAKGLTNGSVPMSATFVSDEIYSAFMQGPEGTIEFFHGYTYSAHPLACAAALATLDTYQAEDLLTRGAGEIGKYFEDGLHSLEGLPHVIDVRNVGLVGGIELAPRPGAAGKRAYEAFIDCWDNGVLVRYTGDVIAVSPPLIVEKQHVDRIVDALGKAIKKLA